MQSVQKITTSEPSLQARIAFLAAEIDALSHHPIDPDACVGHLRVSIGGRRRDVLLCDRTLLTTNGTVLLDWQSAPLGRIFRTTEEGETYRLHPKAPTGTVLQRNLLTVRGGRLVCVLTEDTALRRGADGGWVAAPRRELGWLRHVPQGSFEVELAPEQRAAVELPAGRSALILGEAGFGKTTVAIHRLAALVEQARGDGRRSRSLVLVPTGGLKRLIAAMMRRLGLEQAELQMFDDWIVEVGQQVFSGVPERLSRDASAATIRFKRHPAVQAALPAVSAGRRTRWSDLLELWGDTALLAEIVAASGGALTPRMADEVFEHVCVQFHATTEQLFHTAPTSRLRTADGRSIDEGTPLQDAQSIDAEDFPVLFALDALRGSRARLPAYDHIVIDEAQELAPMELAVVGRCLAEGGTLIVAGDAWQQVDPTACFSGWADTLRAVGQPGAAQVRLTESFRCPAEIVAFGRALFAGAPAPIRAGGRHVRATAFDHLLAQLIGLSAGLRGVRSTTAIIARSHGTARRLHQRLREVLRARLVLDGDFHLARGVVITTVEQVKGIEFDHVVVPDLDPGAYPDTERSRMALYVAVTRASQQAWLTTLGEWSPLVDVQG